jgi:hypothetical protein
VTACKGWITARNRANKIMATKEETGLIVSVALPTLKIE